MLGYTRLDYNFFYYTILSNASYYYILLYYTTTAPKPKLAPLRLIYFENGLGLLQGSSGLI